jgi:hypothetical protein
MKALGKLGRRAATAGSRRRRWMVVVSLAAVAAAMALFVGSAFGVLSGSPSGFEAQDGDMVAANNGGSNDWNSVQGNANYVHLTDLAATTGDDSFKSGQKQDSVCPTINTNKNPPKDDFTDVASLNETNTNPTSAQFTHTFLYGATIRFTPNGNASENVEFNQGKNGNCGTDPVTGVTLLARTTGDKLLAIDYLNGGTNVQFHILTWIDGTDPNNPTCFVGNDSPPCWGAVKTTPAANATEGQANQSLIIAGEDGINGQQLLAGQFAEFGIDLTAAGIIPANSCEAIPQTVWESRSSGSSFVSSTEDIALEHHTINNCGTIKVIKQTNPRGIDHVFSFTSNLNASTTAGGVPCTTGGSAGVAASGNFCLNDTGNSGKTLGSTQAADNSSGNTVTESNLVQKTYTITEGADPADGSFAFDSVTCTSSNSTSTITKTGRQVAIGLTPNDTVVCVYQNNQQTGAIKITKTSSKAAATPLAGAKFAIKDPSGHALAGSPFTTDNNGVVCLDGLTALGNYTVQETVPPAGYARDDVTVHTVAVTATNAHCSDDTFTGQTLTFTDTPLTDIAASATSEVAGGTRSTVTCVNSSNAGQGNSPQSGESPSVTATGLKPGTYTCTIVIDP